MHPIRPVIDKINPKSIKNKVTTLSNQNGLQWLGGKCILNRSLFHFDLNHITVQELYLDSLMVDFINNINGFDLLVCVE
jgi:hypothetical protein